MPDLFGENGHTVRRCCDCGKTFPLEDFPWGRNKGYAHKVYRRWCRKCDRIRQRAYYLQTNGEPWRRANLFRRFGLTLEQYEAMHAAQNGQCAICGTRESVVRGRNRTSYRLSVDHSHTPGGHIRGLLCNRCNRAIGLFEDNPQLLQAAIDYLDKNTPNHDG